MSIFFYISLAIFSFFRRQKFEIRRGRLDGLSRRTPCHLCYTIFATPFTLLHQRHAIYNTPLMPRHLHHAIYATPSMPCINTTTSTPRHLHHAIYTLRHLYTTPFTRESRRRSFRWVWSLNGVVVYCSLSSLLSDLSLAKLRLRSTPN